MTLLRVSFALTILCSCQLSHARDPRDPDAAIRVARDGGAPPHDAGSIADAASSRDAGVFADARVIGPGWALDEGPRVLSYQSDEWLFDPILAAHGDEVALTVGRADDARASARLDAYVESPWSDAWPEDMWTRPRTLSDVALAEYDRTRFATVWDGEGFDAVLRRADETWALTRLTFDAEPSAPLLRWNDLLPAAIAGYPGSSQIVVGRNDTWTEAWMAYNGGAISLARQACGAPIAAMVTDRRFFAFATCPGEASPPHIEIHEVAENGERLDVVRVELDASTRRVGSLALVAGNGGLWLVALTFTGSEVVSVLWRPDGEAPRVVYRYEDQSGESVDAVARLGDRLVLSHGAQDHWGDHAFTLVIVSSDGRLEHLAEHAYAEYGGGRPRALLGSPDATALLVVSYGYYSEEPLSIVRLRAL